MALTGLDIYKQLPKKNCGECGPPTCLAFAMALAAGKGNLESCPYVSEDAKAALSSAAAPPIRLVKFGPADRQVEIGDENVLFRHEKTFVHPTAIAVEIGTDLASQAVTERADRISNITLERVGQQYKVDAIAIVDRADAAAFGAAVTAAVGVGMPLVLYSANADALLAGLEAAGDTKPLVYGADASTLERLAEVVKAKGAPLVIKGEDLESTAALAEKAASLGLKDLVLDTGVQGRSQRLADMTQIRRLAIKKKFRPLGHPTAARVTADTSEGVVIEAVNLVAKYASLVILDAIEPHELMPLLTWRQNVYTDPQKPIQVQPQVYEVGTVGDESPVYVTTNFSLTYFSVEGEIEASKTPAYLIAVDTDGTSVLTAWAAGKFTGETIAEFIKKCGIEDRVKHRNVIIPGHVAVISGKLQDSSGWKVVVGPREAGGIPGFVRANFS